MSRLRTNSEEYRERIESRNLYTPEDPYRLEESSVIEAIDSIASVLSPFNTPDIGNSIIGRLANPINTPIQQIGLQMLAKQFGHTVSSLGRAEFQPSINFANLFDGDPNTKLFTRKVDFQITRRESQSDIGRFLEELTGVNRPINPFTNNPTNLDYFNQTGKGQQILIVGNLNQSIYKPSSLAFQAAVDGADLTFTKPTNSVNITYFTGLNEDTYPFSRYYDFGLLATDASTLNNRLNGERNAFYDELSARGKQYEYGSTDSYLEGLGRVADVRKIDNLDTLNQDFGLDDGINDQIVWGRDGADINYITIRDGFDKNPNVNPDAEGGDSTIQYSRNDRFIGGNRPKTGLLNYTKELLNSRGKYGNFDITKKKFIDKDEEVRFQGLPFTRNAQGEEDRRRQHTIIDPYNRFVKAIRFQGNEIYGGNENSVINKTVMPKLAPEQKGENIDIKNLMFSIENLAFQVSPSGNILDDDQAVKIPECEIGANFGRLMWFAPYDIKFSEQSIAKHTDTVFLGRSEPVYTYNNTERMANLSFKLLIDYPPQIKGNTDINNHMQKGRFFAFGSEGKQQRPVDVGQKLKEIENLQAQIEEPTPELPAVNVTPVSELRFHFPNDIPKSGSESSSVSSVIVNGYEDGDPSNDSYPNDDGLNEAFIDQINRVIDIALKDENIGKYKLTLIGLATDLFDGSDEASRAYNIALSSRRIEAVLSYINQIKGADIEEDLGIIVDKDPEGQASAEAADQDTDNPENINTFQSKFFRRVDIVFEPNENFTEEVDENEDLQRNITRDARNNALRTRIEQLNKEVNQERKRAQQGFECTFNQYTLNDGVFKGWESTQRSVNKFVPVFHSQTPEDFHRRLTFLQQCVRQGAAVRNESDGEDGTNRFSAKNAVFGRQPVQILRLGDFYHTKVIIDNITFEYGEAPWDLNPEGMGAQFMFADITMQMKVIGGQSLSTAVDVLQNAVSFNYYANSTYYDNGVYQKATKAKDLQEGKNNDVRTAFESRFDENENNN